jgi:hypothetical protein
METARIGCPLSADKPIFGLLFFLVGDNSNSTAGVVVVLAAAAATAVAEKRSHRNVIGAATTVYNAPESHRTYSSVKDGDVAGAGNARSMLDSPTVSEHDRFNFQHSIATGSERSGRFRPFLVHLISRQTTAADFGRRVCGQLLGLCPRSLSQPHSPACPHWLRLVCCMLHKH